jgi:hypothetical protein
MKKNKSKNINDSNSIWDGEPPIYLPNYHQSRLAAITGFSSLVLYEKILTTSN